MHYYSAEYFNCCKVQVRQLSAIFSWMIYCWIEIIYSPPPPPLFFFLLSVRGQSSGRTDHLPRIKEALCVFTDIALFHTLRLYSIFSLLPHSHSNDSNPIIFLSPLHQGLILSQLNSLCLPFSTQSPFIILNVFLAFPPFSLLPFFLPS